jgi:hypothetical protein
VINLRYHIISITAIFLALGIGLTLGSTFLDRVTVDNLQSQLTDVSRQVSQTRTQIGDLRTQVDNSAKRDAELAAEMPEQLLGGHLVGVPVVLVVADGTDEDLMTQTRTALASAGAQVAGTWWLTDRWQLDDRSKVSDLSGILGLPETTAKDRLRRNSAIRIAELVSAASRPPAAPPAGGTTTPGPSVEPELIASLAGKGFVRYDAMPGTSDPRVLLPPAGARFVVVSGVAPTKGASVLAGALLDELAAEKVTAVVAAQGATVLPDGKSGAASEDQRRTSFVGPLRTGDVTKHQISTVDDLDLAAGRAALILAVEGVGSGRVGHYGVATGATRLLPAPAGAS